MFFLFSSRRRHTRWNCDWSSDVCSSDLRAHSRDQIFASFLVNTGHKVRVFERELSQDLNQLGKIPVELRLYGYRDNWLGNVVDSFEGDELFHRGESFSGLHVL